MVAVTIRVDVWLLALWTLYRLARPRIAGAYYESALASAVAWWSIVGVLMIVGQGARGRDAEYHVASLSAFVMCTMLMGQVRADCKRFNVKLVSPGDVNVTAVAIVFIIHLVNWAYAVVLLAVNMPYGDLHTVEYVPYSGSTMFFLRNVAFIFYLPFVYASLVWLYDHLRLRFAQLLRDEKKEA